MKKTYKHIRKVNKNTNKFLIGNKGITIIALVITIIILLILAGVSIRAISGENGILSKTNIAKEENKKSEYKDYLSIAKTETVVEKNGQDINLDEYIEQIKKDKIEGIKAIEKITDEKAKVITDEGYIFVITVNTIDYYDNEKNLPDMIIKDANVEFTFNPNTWTNGSVEVTVSKKESKYEIQLSKDGIKWTTTNRIISRENGVVYARLIDAIGRTSDYASRKIDIIDKEKPVVTEAITSTNNVRIKATDNASGIVGYAITTSNTAPTEFTKCDSTKSLDVTVENLKQGTTYYAWVKDAAGNVSTSKSTDTSKVTELTIQLDNADWSTSKIITITATNSNYSNIRYTTDGTIPTAKTGTAISNGGTFTIISNCTIIAVAFDNTEQPGSAATKTVTTIDRIAPSTPSIQYNSGSNECKWENNINISLTSADSQSGIDHYEVDWTGDGNANTTTGANFVPWNGYSSDNNRFRAVDKVGNKSEWSAAIHIHMDTQAPTFTSWWYEYYDTDSIRLRVSTSDNIGIARVALPTSTEIGGYNNWVWADATWDASQGNYIINFNPVTWSHWNTHYVTRLYIWDHAGNGGYYAQSSFIWIGNPVALYNEAGRYYSNITNAINAIGSSGTITMANSITESPTIPAGKNIYLNLNNQTVTGRIMNQRNINYMGWICSWSWWTSIIKYGNFNS